MTTHSRRFLSLCFALSVLLAQSPNAVASDGKFVQMKPIFDTSVLPKKRSPFQIQLKHTDIIYPQNFRAALRGKSDFFSLRADTTTLKGSVSAAPKESTLHLTEHGVTAKFHLDLNTMIPKLAPELARSLEAQISDTQRKLAAQVSAAEPKLQAQLQAPKTASAIPAKPTLDVPDLSKPLAAAAQAQPRMPAAPAGIIDNPIPNKLAAANAAKIFPANLKLAATPAIPGLMQPGSGSLPPGSLGGAPGVNSLSIPSPKPGGNVSKAEQAMRSQLAAANVNSKISSATIDAQRANAKLGFPQLNRDPSVNAQLRMPQTSTDQQVNAQLKFPNTSAKVLPSLDALAAKAKLLPSTKLPAAQGSENAILWDAWHQRFSALAGQAVKAVVNKVGSPKGTNTVSVTVWPNNQLQVSLSKSGNAKFDNAVLQAFKSLNGSKALTYPAGSLRSSVSFAVDNKHTSDDLVTVVSSKTMSGDKEILRR